MTYIDRKKRILSILTIPLLIYAFWLITRILFAADHAAAFPNEYREAANVAIVQALLDGRNPYITSSLSGSLPPVCYLYGMLMSYIASIFSMMLPYIEIQLILYGLSFASVILSALLMALIVRRLTTHIFYPVLTFTLTIFCHWRYGCYLYGAPDSFGLLVMIAVIYCLAMSEMKDSYEHVTYAAILTVAAFFTKQYYLMIAATGVIYYLATSRKRLFHYMFVGGVATAITSAVITLEYPLYWTYTLYFVKGPGAGTGFGKTAQAYNNMQVTYLGGMFLMLFIAVLLYSIYIAVCLKKKQQVRDFKVVVLFYIHAVVAFLVLRYIGNNNGAFITYYLQLFTPALIMLSVIGLSMIDVRALVGRLKGTDAEGQEAETIGLVAVTVAVILFTVYTIYKVEPRLVIYDLSPEEIAQWNETYDILDDYTYGEIYYVPPLAYHAYKNGQYVYNDGQPFVFTEDYLESYEESGLAKKFFPDAGKIIKQHLDYRRLILEKVEKGEYSLLCYIDDNDEVFTVSDMEKAGYRKLKIVKLRTGNWSYDVQLWTKNPDSKG